MNIVFDHQIFTKQSYGGVSRYFVRLAQRLMALGEQVNVVAPMHINRYLKELPCSLVHGVELKQFPTKTGRLALIFNHQLSRFKLRSLRTDILHETNYSYESVSKKMSGRVVTVYDMIHQKYPSIFPANDPAIKYKQLTINRADHVICISHSTKNDLCSIFDVPEDKVSVVHLGFENFEVKTNNIKPLIKTKRPFLLYVGSRWGYKNFDRMLRAIAMKKNLKNEFEIIAFGGGAFTDTERTLMSQLGFGPNDVRQISGNDTVLGCLYAQARAFIYPSVYEGFGMPPLEAMAQQCPVITSNTSSMPEVVGNAGAYFDPLDIESQAQAIDSVVFDDQRRGSLIIAGLQRLTLFSWDRCAFETRLVYQKALKAKGRN